jgi:hypothetical protein
MAYKKIILRRDTAANWTSANPTLSGGEVGIETDTLKMKLGNGSTAWNSLSYYAVPSIDDVGDVTITSASSGQFLKWDGTAWVNDTIDLGTDTAGAYVSSLVAGTGVTLSNNSGETATPTIAIGQAVASSDSPSFAGVTADAITIGVTAAGEIDTTSGNLTIDSAGGTVTIDDDLVVSGNLTVSGTTTTLNTETLAVEDNIIVLNSGVTSTPSTNAGLEVERGTSANVVFRWNETTDKWQVSENGTDYYDVINSDSLEFRIAMEHWHRSARLATAAVLPNTPSYTAGSLDDDGGYGIGATLESSANARLVVDGINATTGDRIIVKNQANAVHNGIYDVTAQGSVSSNWILTRASDFNGHVPGQVSIGENIGSREGDSNYYQQFSISSTGTGTNGTHILGTDNITFVQITGTASFNAGNGLAVSGNTLNVGTADSARIVVNADNIDLAPITQGDNSTTAGLTFVSAVTRDGYGRVTGVTTNDVQVTLSTNTTGDYVQSLTAGTGVTLTGNSGEAAQPTINVDTTVIQARVADVSDTEIGYLNGVTSAIQTQLSEKAPTASPTFTGSVTLPDNTITQSMMSDDSVGTNEIGGLSVTEAKIADGAVTSVKIADGTIVNGDINASAAIATSKISGLDTALSEKAPLASPALTGVPTAPTATAATNTTQIATTEFVRTEVANLVNSATSTLDTLGEIATALGNDPNLSSTLTTAIGLKAPINNAAFTGTFSAPTGTITSAMIADGTIANADVSTTAAIDLNKIADVSTNAQAASYTLVLADKNKIVEMGVGSANNLTVPLNSSVAFPIGTQINILQTGSGQTTVVATGGVTVNATPGLKIRAQWSYATLIKRAENTWVLVGDISA